MEHLEGILKLADAELSSIEKNGKFRSREEIDSVYKLTDIVKDIYCIMDMEDGEDGYSERGYAERYRRYDDDGSYARGRRNARRDSMGRYSRNEGHYRGDSYRGYSRDGKEDYVDHLREMMENAPDEQTRQEFQRMISKMESM